MASSLPRGHRSRGGGVLPALQKEIKTPLFPFLLIVINKDKTEETIYNMYKTRDKIEKLFDTYMNVPDACRLYLQDNETSGTYSQAS